MSTLLFLCGFNAIFAVAVSPTSRVVFWRSEVYVVVRPADVALFLLFHPADATSISPDAASCSQFGGGTRCLV
jgi:hypothetical protein